MAIEQQIEQRQIETTPEDRAKERDGYILTGIGIGALTGFVLGFTFWTHSPNYAIVVATVIFILVMAAAGGVIGKLASGIDFDS